MIAFLDSDACNTINRRGRLQPVAAVKELESASRSAEFGPSEVYSPLSH